MTLMVDTAPIVSLADRKDDKRSAVSRLLNETNEELIVPAPVSAEIDYFLSTRISAKAAHNFLQDIANGRFRVECLTVEEYRLVLALSERYADLNPGLADLSIVVLAHRFDTDRILTFDYRHFRAMEPLHGRSFELLPG
jgi:predicted nucleic acid-binding protein